MTAFLLYAGDTSAAADEIERAGGHVLHVLDGRVLVADAIDPLGLRAAQPERPADLPAESVALADAWLASQRKAAISEESIIPWDHPDFEAPG